MKLPYRNSPCKNCPFRKDCLKGWLNLRIKEILFSHSFVCHKHNNMQCAGHMIINKENNLFVKISNRLGIKLVLENKHLIFNNKEDCVEHHGI